MANMKKKTFVHFEKKVSIFKQVFYRKKRIFANSVKEMVGLLRTKENFELQLNSKSSFEQEILKSNITYCANKSLVV